MTNSRAVSRASLSPVRACQRESARTATEIEQATVPSGASVSSRASLVSGQPDFRPEAFNGFFVERGLRLEEFDGDLFPDFCVEGLEDTPHPACPDFFDDLIAVGKKSPGFEFECGGLGLGLDGPKGLECRREGGSAVGAV